MGLSPMLKCSLQLIPHTPNINSPERKGTVTCFQCASATPLVGMMTRCRAGHLGPATGLLILRPRTMAERLSQPRPERFYRGMVSSLAGFL
eukprot:CAMPEP_0181415396 /NCGR_PEP_ID=MMETSP1110-20121109/9996_1 /TAXON_ID=174948 /ORGANISM="Symbiodinium sp., Strain CCMP421" /LENGTH=90 /DNA_ID=CAMNT_0023538299 /DNA_START=57 /DNA_END=326 /DNA_ORIENTATION=-